MGDKCARENYGWGRCVFLTVGCGGDGEHWCSGSSLGCGLMGRGRENLFLYYSERVHCLVGVVRCWQYGVVLGVASTYYLLGGEGGVSSLLILNAAEYKAIFFPNPCR